MTGIIITIFDYIKEIKSYLVFSFELPRCLVLKCIGVTGTSKIYFYQSNYNYYISALYGQCAMNEPYNMTSITPGGFAVTVSKCSILRWG